MSQGRIKLSAFSTSRLSAAFLGAVIATAGLALLPLAPTRLHAQNSKARTADGEAGFQRHL